MYIWDYKNRSQKPYHILRTRKSMRAIHFHPTNPRLLLTAERRSSGHPPAPAFSPSASSGEGSASEPWQQTMLAQLSALILEAGASSSSGSGAEPSTSGSEAHEDAMLRTLVGLGSASSTSLTPTSPPRRPLSVAAAAVASSHASFSRASDGGGRSDLLRPYDILDPLELWRLRCLSSPPGGSAGTASPASPLVIPLIHTALAQVCSMTWGWESQAPGARSSARGGAPRFGAIRLHGGADDVEYRLPASGPQDLPCMVNINIWRFDHQRYLTPLSDGALLLCIPRVVLCR